RAPSLTGPDGTPSAPLLDRDEERHRLHRFLSRGRSVRLTAPPGAGRSALLAAVARDCADLAPDGVIRLSGYRRTPEDLLHELYAAVHHTPAYRPGSTELAAALRVIGAVVVVDDLEFGGAALDELLDATPECAFLLAAHPGVPGPENPSRVEEAELTGLDLDACLELLRRALGRALEPAEADWAAGVWRDTGGLPRRFAQAAGVAGSRPPADRLATALADGSPEAGREILRYAVALGGELPGPERLAAMTGNPGAPAAHGELLTHGLIGIAGLRHRLAPGIQGELLAAGYGEGSADRLHTAAQHYAWWLSRPEATHADAAEEAEALLAVATAALRAGHAAAVSALARAAAPLLAAGPRWGVWEGMLHAGLEAAGAAEEVAQQAYFRHELGVLAILHGRFDRARAELEASTELHSAVEDTGGLLMDRRALALVTDLTTPPARAALLPVPAPIGPPPPPAVGAEDQTQVIP
ncbi:ATP-binding protein, partial [Streptomyces sp. DSM 44917]|nr:ATP-binding protein [Streptomyces sp. DSM 44917]